MAGGIAIAVIGVLVLTQVLKGHALDRLAITA